MFNSLDVQDHMEVVGSNGEHVGTVDHKENANRIILTKDDPTEPDRPNKIVFSHSVQAKIGQELRARFEMPHELPHRMLTLIMQFDANRSGAIR